MRRRVRAGVAPRNELVVLRRVQSRRVRRVRRRGGGDGVGAEVHGMDDDVDGLGERQCWRTGSPLIVLVALFTPVECCSFRVFAKRRRLFPLHRHVLGRYLEHPHALLHMSSSALHGKRHCVPPCGRLVLTVVWGAVLEIRSGGWVSDNSI